MNKGRILFRRGENAPLVNSLEKIFDGQPVYNSTKNYMTVGTSEEKKYKELKPLKVMELFGFFDDLTEIKASNVNRYFKLTGNGSELRLEVVGKDLENKNNVSITAVNNGTKLVLLDSSGNTIVPNSLKVSNITTESGDLTIVKNSSTKLFINREISSTEDKITFLKPIKLGSTEILSSEVKSNSFTSTGLSSFSSVKINTTLEVLNKSTFKDGKFSDKLETKEIVNSEKIKSSEIDVESNAKFSKNSTTNKYTLIVNPDGSVTINGNVKINGQLTVVDLHVES